MPLRLAKIGCCAAALACIFGAGGAGAGAGGPLAVGIASDEPYVTNDGAHSYYGALRDMGMNTSRLVVVWDASTPTTIVDKEQLDRLVSTARGYGIQPFFNLTQARPDMFSSADNRAAFANFLGLLARTYPEIDDYVVGNEPNVTYFWRPQFNADDTPRAPGDFVDLLARSYDALKAVNAGITVTAGGLDARGNDNPDARSNISNSPVRFIKHMGDAYRASGRNRPLFDQVAFHPYPLSSRDSYNKSYAWPNAGMADLDRLKQAYWDAFHGTAQPTFEDGLTISLDETGWQTAPPPEHAGAYNSSELNDTIDEATQAQIYADMIRYLECDPSVSNVLVYRLMDESDLKRWQSGVMRADGSLKPSYDAIKQTIAQTGGRCSAAPRAFRHATSVVGASVKFQVGRRPARATAFSFTATAEENAVVQARIMRVSSKTGASATQRAALSTALPSASVASASGNVQARWVPVVAFPARRLKPGWYVYAVRMTAEANPDRSSTFVSAAFRVG